MKIDKWISNQTNKLEISCEDGGVEILGTDESWRNRNSRQ